MAAATRLFSERGFDGVRTREIAEEAGMSEAMIFRVFGSKQDLYAAVISEAFACGGAFAFGPLLDAERDEREVLAAIVQGLLQAASDDPDHIRIRLLFFSALCGDRSSKSACREYLAGSLAPLVQYIRLKSEQGRFREVDAAAAARGFVAAIFGHWVQQELIGGSHRASSLRQAGYRIADAWLKGMYNVPAAASTEQVSATTVNAA